MHTQDDIKLVCNAEMILTYLSAKIVHKVGAVNSVRACSTHSHKLWGVHMLAEMTSKSYQSAGFACMHISAV